MSDTVKRRASFQEIQFLYESAVRNALDILFTNSEQHGWTEKEYNEANFESIRQRIAYELDGGKHEQEVYH